jgi:hypothetical protein
MRIARSALLTLTLTATLPALALAQTQVTDRGDIAGGTTLTWDAVGAPSTPFTVGDITASTDGDFQRYTSGVNWFGGFASGDELLFANDGSQITFDFSSPITGFATQGWFNYTPTGSAQFFIDAYRGGSLLGSFMVAGSGGGVGGPAPVLGFEDAAGFDRVVLRGVRTDQNPTEFAVNQLTLGSGVATVTPEPATLALLGTGLLALGMGGLRRRRARV